jgi:hypothetical protein
MFLNNCTFMPGDCGLLGCDMWFDIWVRIVFSGWLFKDAVGIGTIYVLSNDT